MKREPNHQKKVNAALKKLDAAKHQKTRRCQCGEVFTYDMRTGIFFFCKKCRDRNARQSGGFDDYGVAS
jgi:hypothetical protein